MANDLDKTIEELEAEVLAELEEANAPDAPKKNAVPAEKMDSVDGEVQDTGAAVVDPEQKDSPAKKAAGSAKAIKGDKAQSGAGAAEKMDTVKEEDESDTEEVAEAMSYDEMKDEMMSGMKGMKKADVEGLYNAYVASKSMTKDEMVKTIKDGMSNMKIGEMKKLHASYMSDDAHSSEEEDAKTEERLKSVDVEEHVKALLGADNTLSEDFKVKAATIFETAVKSKIREEIKRLEEEYKNELFEEVEDVRSSLTEKVDNYLNYVVDEWMRENELAIERGLKGEIAEDFISGLKTLFEDHYIDVPDEKYDVLEAQADKISQLEEKVETMIQQIAEAKSSNSDLIKEKVMKDITSDMTDTEVEKFESLAQDVEFTEAAVYEEKLNTLKESYFPKVVHISEHDEVETGTAVQDITEESDAMAAYMSAIGRTVKSAN